MNVAITAEAPRVRVGTVLTVRQCRRNYPVVFVWHHQRCTWVCRRCNTSGVHARIEDASLAAFEHLVGGACDVPESRTA